MSPDPSDRSVALVVEDEPLIAMEAVNILEDDGFVVHEAWNAESALALLEKEGPVTLLFTDVHMPGAMNGYALAREVKRRWPDTMVVICSGHMKPTEHDMPEGAVFIDKPFTTQLVIKTIAALPRP